MSGCAQLPLQPPAARSSTDGTIIHDGVSRAYHLHIPPGLDASPHPLLVMLHGGLGSGSGMEASEGMDDDADALGFYVVYPEGTAQPPQSNLRTWNAVDCCGAAHKQNVDDVGFLADLIMTLEANYNIDVHRVGVAGHSNGAMMAYRFAGERSDLVTSVMSVSGAIGGQENPASSNKIIATPAQHVSALIMHARDDDHVPYNGGHGQDAVEPLRVDMSVAQALAFWIAADGVSSTAASTSDAGVVHTETYGTTTGPFVELVATQGGHGWPGATGQSPLAKSPAAPDASSVVAHFLMDHPR